MRKLTRKQWKVQYRAIRRFFRRGDLQGLVSRWNHEHPASIVARSIMRDAMTKAEGSAA